MISAKVIKSAKLVTLCDMIYLSQLVVVGEVDDELWLWLVRIREVADRINPT